MRERKQSLKKPGGPVPVQLKRNRREQLIYGLFFLAALVSVITTVGIVATLIGDAFLFFRQVPLREVFGTNLAPLRAEPSFGFIPIITGTLVTSLIAMAVAAPVGLMTAMYLSEFASPLVRKILKPVLEVLAGVPTIVYGFCLFFCDTAVDGHYTGSGREERPQSGYRDGNHDHSDGDIDVGRRDERGAGRDS